MYQINKRFTKHIGRHNNKRVIIVYRFIPDEEHMCLVVYTDTLGSLFSDTITRAVEGDVGQSSDNVADVIFRHVLPDGRNALEALHREGLLKKVPTSQVIVTPDSVNSIRLDELNNLLKQMQDGEEAVNRLAEIDSQLGMAKGQRERRVTSESVETLNESLTNDISANSVNTDVAQSDSFGVLTDEQLAKQRLEQVAKIRADVTRLLAEAERLEQEAQALMGAKANTTTTSSDSTVGSNTNDEQAVKPKRGRKPKVAQGQ